MWSFLHCTRYVSIELPPPQLRPIHTCWLMACDSLLGLVALVRPSFRAVNMSWTCSSPSTSSLPTPRPARARDLSHGRGALQGDGDAVWCSLPLGLILMKGRKWSEGWFAFVIMHIVCHLCWFSWCFEVSLALVLCLRQNCLLLHCSCYFTCFYVLFYFIVLPCQFRYNSMKFAFGFML